MKEDFDNIGLSFPGIFPHIFRIERMFLHQSGTHTKFVFKKDGNSSSSRNWPTKLQNTISHSQTFVQNNWSELNGHHYLVFPWTRGSSWKNSINRFHSCIPKWGRASLSIGEPNLDSSMNAIYEHPALLGQGHRFCVSISPRIKRSIIAR